MKINKLLIANRSEIAIRIMRAASELGIQTVAVYANADRQSLHRFKADEAYLIRSEKNGVTQGPVQSYLNGDEILSIAKQAGVDAIHPGYGFLSENPDFADQVIDNGFIWIGPKPDIMRQLGNKVQARELAIKAGLPVLPATDPLPDDMELVSSLATDIGYPLMLKASWGGGGRGMRVIRDEDDLHRFVAEGKKEAQAAFGNSEMYLEKFIERACHVEVQILGDLHGNIIHLFERDCSIQRRNQKVIERAPAQYLSNEAREELCAKAIQLAKCVDYHNAGTVEFLMNQVTGEFYFIEVNPRIQVEHTVTEVITGIDLVKSQILLAEGNKIGEEFSGIPHQKDLIMNGHAIQCRITTEDPENEFVPDYGRISFYRDAAGFGVRQDSGSVYTGAVINPYYDSLLEKLTIWAPTPEESISRVLRALKEVRIRGVTTNIAFLVNLISHPAFSEVSYTTSFIDTTPELFIFPKPRDRASRLLNYIADVSINGNSMVAGREKPETRCLEIAPPDYKLGNNHQPETAMSAKYILDKNGPEAVSCWMLEQTKLLLTDTTMRDAHQSLLATRLRTYDMEQIAPYYHYNLQNLFSVECWGGATFDVSMRFLKECPWQRLAALRSAMPNTLLQMLLRGANAVGYTNYPDNVVRAFIDRAAINGIDIFRVFDSLNWVENMRVAMDAVLESGKILEATVCFTGDFLNPQEKQYTLEYYLTMATELKRHGAHIIGLKDMAGVLKPEAAEILISALKLEIGLPVHLHNHDTSGIGSATLLAAARVGVDAVDAAMDSFSGLTSQPNLGSIVEALRFTDRCPNISAKSIREVSGYWGQVREQYSAFDVDIKSGVSEVYLHAMPGGQYTNLKEQARSLNIADRWGEIAQTYAEVNKMFGDIVKVTPTSKVVGDMTLFMISSGLSTKDILSTETDISFPESVIQFFQGNLGQPPSGFPTELQKKVLNGVSSITVRPGSLLAPIDIDLQKQETEKKLHQKISEDEINSYLMYPEVFCEYASFKTKFGNVSKLPTSVFFYGLTSGETISVEIDRGKVLDITCLAISDADPNAIRNIYFELNGQLRIVQCEDFAVDHLKIDHKKADPLNNLHVGAPISGVVSSLDVVEGQAIKKGDLLLTIEAMKMETSVYAKTNGIIRKVHLEQGDEVENMSLIIELNSHIKDDNVKSSGGNFLQ